VGEIAIIALVCGGAFFAFVAAVGLLRLPDLYTRAHSASKSDTLGAVLALAGVALVFGADIALAKTLFLLAFMFITNPTAAHAITRAAHDQGIEPWTVADRDAEVGPATTERATETETDPEPAADGGTTVGDTTAGWDEGGCATDGDATDPIGATDAAREASAADEGERAGDDGRPTRTDGDGS